MIRIWEAVFPRKRASSRRFLQLKACCAVSFIIGGVGCVSTPPTDVVQPISIRAPERPVTTRPMNGSIFHAQASMASLFEDVRPRHVGDILTVQISENLNASRNSSTTANRTASDTTTVSSLAGMGVSAVTKALGLGSVPLPDISASSSNKLDGKGQMAASDVFTGTITVTVIDVLPNGYLQISGEKVVALGNSKEYLRLSGVVDPVRISPTNVVLSTQVADARIEYKGTGTLRDVQDVGWLQRIFLSISPF